MCVIFTLSRVRSVSSIAEHQGQFTSCRSPRSRQAGWMIFEVIISLALLGLVLTLAQHQITEQWRIIERSQTNQIASENRSKADAMARLTAQNAWRETLEVSSAPNNQGYPRCQHCSDEELKQWFNAAQYASLSGLARDKTE